MSEIKDEKIEEIQEVVETAVTKVENLTNESKEDIDDAKENVKKFFEETVEFFTELFKDLKEWAMPFLQKLDVMLKSSKELLEPEFIELKEKAKAFFEKLLEKIKAILKDVSVKIEPALELLKKLGIATGEKIVGVMLTIFIKMNEITVKALEKFDELKGPILDKIKGLYQIIEGFIKDTFSRENLGEIFSKLGDIAKDLKGNGIDKIFDKELIEKIKGIFSKIIEGVFDVFLKGTKNSFSGD